MSINGSMIAVSPSGNNSLPQTIEETFDLGKVVLDLSAFFWDINYVLTKYMNNPSESLHQIMYGNTVIVPDGSGEYLAYSTPDEVQKSADLIQNITLSDFERSLDQCLEDKTSIIHCYLGDEPFKSATLEIFERTKLTLQQAATNKEYIYYYNG